VNALRLLLVSDTHLSSRAPEALANWAAVAAYAAETSPDLVVHLGDLTLDGVHEPSELADAREQLDRLPVPWRAVPGNHDIGDHPWRGHSDEHTVTAARLDRWHRAIGADYWSFDRDGWTLVAIDAQLLGSGLEAEHAQWAWLETTIAAQPQDRRVGLLTHKPLTAGEEELAASPQYRFIPPEPRQRLEGLLAGRDVPLVLSGHVHQHRDSRIDHRRHLWAPTSWATLPDDVQPLIGAKRCGIVALTLDRDGTIRSEIVEPRGLRQLTLAHDIPSPYV
jgi:3',5'-cyclic AMP phosphodiesterase CpdA